MSDVTQILSKIEQGDPRAAAELLPLVYDELRKLAAVRMANERPDHTLQATSLVHEAYLRLVDTNKVHGWNGRGHFFSAAAEAMRRILVENARRKQRVRHGGGMKRVDLDDADGAAGFPADELLSMSEAIDSLERHDLEAAQLVKVRLFTGLSVEESAKTLDMSRTNAYRHWTYARAWLFSHVHGLSE